MSTLTEAMNSITGFDEIAIEKHFGLNIYTDAEQKPGMATRAVVFVDLKHNGATDTDAYAQAMNMTARDLNTYFEPEPEEVVPSEPETESGKDS